MVLVIVCGAVSARSQRIDRVGWRKYGESRRKERKETDIDELNEGIARAFPSLIP
jgi:hypothetical protein